MKLYDQHSSAVQLDRMKKLQNRYISQTGKPFVRMSDEFYVIAKRDVPDTDFYDGFGQLEDGIGMIRIFRNNIENSLKMVEDGFFKLKGSFTFVTGKSAYVEIKNAVEKIRELNEKIYIDVKGIVNNFFGNTITVAGLITATDIMEQTRNTILGDNIIIPDCMLRKGYELGSDKRRVFLDDITVEQLENKLDRNILVCEYSGEDLLDIIIQNCIS